MTNTQELLDSSRVSMPQADRFFVETPAWSVMVMLRTRPENALWSSNAERKYRSKVRVYGAVDVFAPEYANQETSLVLAANRRDPNMKDPELARLQRAALATVRNSLPDALFTLERVISVLINVAVSIPIGKWSFSRKAGCWCPCSPGFIGPERLFVDWRPVDLYFERCGSNAKNN